MKLTLKRHFCGEKYTIGNLYIDNVYYCDTLEDKTRNLPEQAKILGETAIPEGTYKIIVNMSPRLGRELPRLLDVPHFEGILIHRGNTAQDTSGCILVGENTSKGRISNSTKYEIELTALLKSTINKHEECSITISNPSL